jgi:hypothetical protein
MKLDELIEAAWNGSFFDIHPSLKGGDSYC